MVDTGSNPDVSEHFLDLTERKTKDRTGRNNFTFLPDIIQGCNTDDSLKAK